MEAFRGLQSSLVMTPQPEGGYTVTSPLLPELVTEGDSICDALENVKDALAAVVELYEELGRALPQNTRIPDRNSPVWFETVIAAP
jgi:antitoxin HicB